MKKIYFGSDSDPRLPFWQPWGVMGWLGRFLAFILLLSLLLLMLSLFRECNRVSYDYITDPDWNKPVAGGEEVGLPSPEENFLPPFEEMPTVPNPENDGASEIYPNLLYVIFNSNGDDQTYLTFAEKFTSLYPPPAHKIEYYNTGSKTAVLSVPEEKRDSICEMLPQKISEVDFYVVPVEVMSQYAEYRPSDPGFNDESKTWYLENIQAYEAWDITKGSSDIIVGIVDSYMDLSHPELRGDRCIYPYSVVKGNSDVAPREGAQVDYANHGTMVTSIAVGSMDNGHGTSGIAPKCKFIPVSMGENLNTITQVEGLLYCMYHGAHVINLSCGAAFPSEIINMPVADQIEFSKQAGTKQEEMWDYVFELAEERNVTIVWAAGNEHCFCAMDASKRNSGTIRVSAIDEDNQRAHFSNFGNFSHLGLYESTISAPGVNIMGAIPNNSYSLSDGTSFSAPIIAGVVALIKSENRDLTTSQIIEILQATGKPLTNSTEIGNMVQIRDALVKAKESVASARVDTEN